MMLIPKAINSTRFNLSKWDSERLRYAANAHCPYLQEDVFQVPTKTGMGGQESFRVANLSTQTSYTVQLATKLRLGESLSLGKRSPEVRIATPLFGQYIPHPATLSWAFGESLSLGKRPPEVRITTPLFGQYTSRPLGDPTSSMTWW